MRRVGSLFTLSTERTGPEVHERALLADLGHLPGATVGNDLLAVRNGGRAAGGLISVGSFATVVDLLAGHKVVGGCGLGNC